MSISNLLHHYNCPEGVWDEMRDRNQIREQYRKVFNTLQQLDISNLQQKDALAGELFMNQGITFTVYSDNAGIERIFPFDIIPRIITAKEWDHVEKGIQQRLKAFYLHLQRNCSVYFIIFIPIIRLIITLWEFANNNCRKNFVARL